MEHKITIEELEIALKKSWCKETCHHDFLWEDKELPNSAGHCRVTSLIVQDYFGGEILYSYVKGNKNWDHYWNILPNGKQVDLTSDQFPKGVVFIKPKLISRQEALSSPITQRGYILLKRKIEDLLKK